jgi:hypothetical protein
MMNPYNDDIIELRKKLIIIDRVLTTLGVAPAKTSSMKSTLNWAINVNANGFYMPNGQDLSVYVNKTLKNGNGEDIDDVHSDLTQSLNSERERVKDMLASVIAAAGAWDKNRNEMVRE